jgi:hypothetical protein
MVLSSAQEHGTSLLLLEGGLTAIALAVAFGLPRLGSTWFSPVERSLGKLARSKKLSAFVVGALAILLRLAILPLCPIPHPFVPDDFSFLLAADTFASGRLTNPTPPMWVHLESIHITMKPTYMSMYFPTQGLALAAGKVLLGHPWYGILAMTGLMCGAICWMLQAWLPPTWALLGGLLAVLRLGLFSYWINSYSGAGCLSALGGALVLGALPRFMNKVRLRDSVLLAVGVVLVGTSRPYDGMLLCLPVVCFLAWWMRRGKNRPTTAVLLRRTAIPLTLFIAAGLSMAYYNYRVFGNPTTLPYTVNRAQYAVAPYFIWQSPRPEPLYRHQAIRDFYERNELDEYEKIHSLSGFVTQTLIKATSAFLFYAGLALLVPLIMLRRVLLDRRIRFLVLCVLVLTAGQLIEVFFLPHYLAPFTAAFYAIGLQTMRHLRLWNPGGQPVGKTLVRLTVSLCVVLAAMRVFAEPLHLRFAQWPGTGWMHYWTGPGEFGVERVRIMATLEQQSERHLVIIRYSPNHEPLNEWTYNAPDIDGSKVIWAREMDDAQNLELIHYYRDRSVWLVQPDTKPVSVSVYPAPLPIR